MATIPEEPHTNLEQYLNRIATGDGEIPAAPRTNVEEYLNYIIENGIGGGGKVEIVDELPEEGEEGVLYYLRKTGTDTFDLYRWIENDWVKVDTDIKLYDATGQNTDGAMTQKAVTDALAEKQDAIDSLSDSIDTLDAGVATLSENVDSLDEDKVDKVGKSEGEYEQHILSQLPVIKLTEHNVLDAELYEEIGTGLVEVDSSTNKMYMLTGIGTDEETGDKYPIFKEIAFAEDFATLTDAQYNALWSNDNQLTAILTTIATGAGV